MLKRGTNAEEICALHNQKKETLDRLAFAVVVVEKCKIRRRDTQGSGELAWAQHDSNKSFLDAISNTGLAQSGLAQWVTTFGLEEKLLFPTKKLKIS